jgi:molybdopterin-containing oxidoreductase family iron-sulfur binding subunit
MGSDAPGSINSGIAACAIADMNPNLIMSRSGLDLAALREKLNGAQGQQYWRSLDELAQTPQFEQMLHREFPAGAAEWADGLDRRSFFKLAAASLALAGLTACTKQPNAKILPYVKQPEQLVPGEPIF